MRRHPAALLLTLGLTAHGVAAQDPVSAIDWLTQSIKNPPPFAITPDQPPLQPDFRLDIIEQAYVGNTTPDAIGLLAPDVTGLPTDMWGDLDVTTASERITRFPLGGLPEVDRLFRHILLAQANPPRGSDDAGLLLQARVDRLFETGALDPAEALLSLVHRPNAALFQRTFDIGILTGRTLQVCKMLAETPALTRDLGQRVFCLARGGDWNAAAITLSLGASIGAISPEREELLIRFLDPILFEGAPDPPVPDPLEPLDFVLREAVLLPRPGRLLPLAYIYKDTAFSAPQRMRLEALERLVKSGAMPSGVLFAAYREGTPAASGGVWGRQKAVQALDHALESGAPAAIADAIAAALPALDTIGLRFAFAQEYADRFAALPVDPAFDPVAAEILDTIYLEGLNAGARDDYVPQDPARALARHIAHREPATTHASADPLLRAIADGLGDTPPDSTQTRELLAQLDKGNAAAAILGALELLAEGRAGDPAGIRTGLYVLGHAGQDSVARRIALQILLLPEEG